MVPQVSRPTTAAEVVFDAGSFWYATKLQGIEGKALTAAQQRAEVAIDSAARLGVTFDSLGGFDDNS